VLELKLRLLGEAGVVATDVPVLDEPGAQPVAAEEIEPADSAAFVIVPAVDDATVNAVNYAQALHAFETRALYFALHPEKVDDARREWERRRLPIELEVIDCPFRELGGPLLDHVRRATHHRDGVAAVVLPEVLTGDRVQRPLNGRRALYLRWLLLFEPRVVLSTVPYRTPRRGSAGEGVTSAP
jgi:hypothetical protein